METQPKQRVFQSQERFNLAIASNTEHDLVITATRSRRHELLHLGIGYFEGENQTLQHVHDPQSRANDTRGLKVWISSNVKSCLTF